MGYKQSKHCIVGTALRNNVCKNLLSCSSIAIVESFSFYTNNIKQLYTIYFHDLISLCKT